MTSNLSSLDNPDDLLLEASVDTARHVSSLFEMAAVGDRTNNRSETSERRRLAGRTFLAGVLKVGNPPVEMFVQSACG